MNPQETLSNRLAPQVLTAFGVEEGWAFGLFVRVRWSEVDPFGHANHRSHLLWFEEARNRYLEVAGYPLRDAQHAGPVLRTVTCHYEQSVEFGQELLVTAKTDWIGKTSFGMSYAIWREGLVARGSAVCVWHVNAAGRSEVVPDALRTFMKSWDAAVDKAPTARA